LYSPVIATGKNYPRPTLSLSLSVCLPQCDVDMFKRSTVLRNVFDDA